MTQRPLPQPNSFFLGLGLAVIIGLFALSGWLILGKLTQPATGSPQTGAQGNAEVAPTVPMHAGEMTSTGGTPPDSSTEGQFPVGTANLPVVCIDPGHPSEVNRATTVQNGLKEVEVVYDVALKLKHNLENLDDGEPIARVVMTRDYRNGTGKIVTNRERAEIANKAGATVLVRLHCDTGKGAGYTIYYPDRAGKAKDGKTGPSQKVIASSGKLAKAFHDGMVEIMRDAQYPLQDNGVKGDSATFIGSKQGALTGSVYSKVPAITVEMVFLSNPHDARIIGSEEGQQEMADALTFGVIRSLEAFGYRK